MKRICEYPECNKLGFPIGQKEGSAILCPEHEKALDYLLDNEREKEAMEFILTVTANRIQNNLTNNGKEN